MVVQMKRRQSSVLDDVDVRDGTALIQGVPLADMFVDYRDIGGYARPLQERRKQRLIKEFDIQAIGVILLSLRNNGSLAIIDGQHRVEAAKAHGLTALDAKVWTDLSLQDEARLYRKFGDYLRQLPVDRYVAALVEGEEKAVAVDKVLRDFNLKVSMGARGSGISAIAAVQAIMEQQGEPIMRDTFALLIEALGSDSYILNGSTLRGTAMFLDRFGEHPKYNRSRLIQRLARGGFNEFEQRARAIQLAEGIDVRSAWGKAVMAIHDTGLQPSNKLAVWIEKVYSPETKAKMAENLISKAMPVAKKVRRTEASKRAGAVACKDCGALPGVPCESPTGYAHERRIRQAARERRRVA